MKFKSIFLAAVLTLAFAGYAYAHCGMCGVGEAKEEGHADHATCLCGMAVEGEGAASAEHEGVTYRFCSLECAAKFKEDPVAAIAKMKVMAEPKAEEEKK